MRLWPAGNNFTYNLNRLPYVLGVHAKKMGVLPTTNVPWRDVCKKWPSGLIAFGLLAICFAIEIYLIASGNPNGFSRFGSAIVAVGLYCFASQISKTQDSYNLAAERFTFKMYFDDFTRHNNAKFDLPGTLTPPNNDDGYQMLLWLSVRNSVSWVSGGLAIIGTLQWGYGEFFHNWVRGYGWIAA